MQKAQNDNFDEFAANYREVHTENVQKLSGKDSEYFSEYKIVELSRRFDTDKKIRILDLGCGDGICSKFFRSIFKNSSYTGIDISEESVDVAKKQYSSLGDVSFEVYDGEHIPFEDNSFDLVFIACVMHHIKSDNHKQIVSECRRVLKDQGSLVIFEHNPNNPVTMKAVNTCPFDKDAVLMKSKYLKRLMTDCGLAGAKVRYTIFIPRVGILEKLVPLERGLYWCPMGGQYYVTANKQEATPE